MSVHGFIPELSTWVLPIVTSGIGLIGLYRLFSEWGHGSPIRFFSAWAHQAFRDGTRVFLRVLILDVLLFRRIWRRSRRRWAVHMAMFWTFATLGGFVILSIVALVLSMLDPTGPGGMPAQYLKDLQLNYSALGYLLVIASGSALARRLVVRDVRHRTRPSDLLLVGGIFTIGVTGMVAEWFSGYDFLIGKTIMNWDLALQVLSLHCYAVFLLFVMMMPWTRFKHIITSPLLQLARRGGE